MTLSERNSKTTGTHRRSRLAAAAAWIAALSLIAAGCGTAPSTQASAATSAAASAETTAASSASENAAATTAASSEEKTAASAAGSLDKVTVVLDWTPNTNHTGLYSAAAQGFYQAEGIEAEIIQPGDGTADTMVAAGTAQFGVSYQESVTFARASNVPLVSLAAVIQHNSSGFASVKDKGIATPKDFEGKKYGGWGSDIEKATLKVLMEQDGGDVEKVDILTSGTADFFQASESGQVDFAWIFEGWTGIEAKLKGVELNYIDLGKEAEVFDYYTPVLVTSEDMIAKNPDLVARFMRATAKGYEFAASEPEKAAEDLLAGAPELDRALVVESQKFLASRYTDDAAYWGEQKTEVWDRYAAWLHENGFIDTLPDMSKAWTNDYLNK